MTNALGTERGAANFTGSRIHSASVHPVRKGTVHLPYVHFSFEIVVHSTEILRSEDHVRSSSCGCIRAEIFHTTWSHRYCGENSQTRLYASFDVFTTVKIAPQLSLVAAQTLESDYITFQFRIHVPRMESQNPRSIRFSCIWLKFFEVRGADRKIVSSANGTGPRCKAVRGRSNSRGRKFDHMYPLLSVRTPMKNRNLDLSSIIALLSLSIDVCCRSILEKNMHHHKTRILSIAREFRYGLYTFFMTIQWMNFNSCQIGCEWQYLRKFVSPVCCTQRKIWYVLGWLCTILQSKSYFADQNLRYRW